MSRVATPAPINPRAISSKIQSRSPVKGSVPVPSVFSVPRTPACACDGVESAFVAPSTPPGEDCAAGADCDGGGVGVFVPSAAAAAVVVVVAAAVVVVATVVVVAAAVVTAVVVAVVVTLGAGPGHGP